jgi:serine phosphatase RsbU (regulator of sigma subunit)
MAFWTGRKRPSPLAERAMLGWPSHRRTAASRAISQPDNPPLGMLEDFRYEEVILTLGPGDILALRSDGVAEARPANGGEEFGEKRVLETLAATRSQGVGKVVRDLRDQALRFSGLPAPADDMIVIGLEMALAAG